jgi:hypothetical protein
MRIVGLQENGLLAPRIDNTVPSLDQRPSFAIRWNLLSSIRSVFIVTSVVGLVGKHSLEM